MYREFEETLSCGVKLQIFQPEIGQTVLLRLTAPEGQNLTSVAQVRNNKITVAIDPANLPRLAKITQRFFGPPITFWDFIKNRYNWRKP